jgi:hypothetical protein
MPGFPQFVVPPPVGQKQHCDDEGRTVEHQNHHRSHNWSLLSKTEYKREYNMGYQRIMKCDVHGQTRLGKIDFAKQLCQGGPAMQRFSGIFSQLL